jgi:hypothetical protein
MLRTYHGSCHCGGVRFECSLDLSDGTRRCNCSFCAKTRMWKVFALGDSFRLTAGEELLSDYRSSNSNWDDGAVHHYFCSRCGVRGFSKGYLEMEPFNGWFHAVNVATLDDLTDEERAAIPIQYENGREDDYDRPAAITSYL